MSLSNGLENFIVRIEQQTSLTEADRQAIRALPYTMRIVPPHTYFVREGEKPRPVCNLVVSGLAFRQKISVNGARQILSLHLPGDLLDLQTLYLNIVDHSIQAASEIRVLEIDRDKLKQVAMEHPAFGRALVEAALIEASVQREWVLNVGRRDARTRVAHLICELEIRMRVAGVIESAGFQLPMTQEQLGDATGLTAVHLNRTLKGLVKDGLIDQQGRQIEILDRQGLKRAGDFSSLYLHLDQIAPGFAGA